jgi:pyruvate/2-oxoglutarate dehydrogenase complex dihydrolipoamide dehydrogenase (E3) component
MKIWAIGRSPNVEKLHLEKVGVKLDEHGFIGTDEYQNTRFDLTLVFVIHLTNNFYQYSRDLLCW